MKLYKTLRSTLLFVVAALMLCVIPVLAADEAQQADYELFVSSASAEDGDVLTISAGDKEYVYAVSAKAVGGLDISDSRSYAGDFAAVAGAENMLLTLTDPACGGIAADGSWKDALGADDVTVTFNGEEQDFSGSLELECALGTLTLDKDGSIRFAAKADAAIVTISQRMGNSACSVSLKRSVRELPADSSVNVTLKESKSSGFVGAAKPDKKEWVGIPLPSGMIADPDALSWSEYVQFSAAKGNLFCRQTKLYPFKAKQKVAGITKTLGIMQGGSLSASGDWTQDLGKFSKKVVRFNGAGHAYGAPDTVTDGIFALHRDRWYYTADDTAAGAFQFTSQQQGVELMAAVGRGDVPELAAAGGETLRIESDGQTYTHTMQRLSHAEGNAPEKATLTVNVYIVP